MSCYLLPRPKPDPKIVHFMARSWTRPTRLYSAQTKTTYQPENLKLTSLRLQHACPEIKVITSYNMFIRNSNYFTWSVWGMRGTFVVYPRKKMSHTTIKNAPTHINPKLNFPTWHENILKDVPSPQTGFGLVRGNSWVWVAPQSCLHCFPTCTFPFF